MLMVLLVVISDITKEHNVSCHVNVIRLFQETDLLFSESCFYVTDSAFAESWNTATVRTIYICWRMDSNALVMLGPSTLDGMLIEQYAQRANRKEPRALWLSQNGWEADHQDHGDRGMLSLWRECTCRRPQCWLSWTLKSLPLWAP